jgi:hypothetical protein
LTVVTRDYSLYENPVSPDFCSSHLFPTGAANLDRILESEHFGA